MQQIIYFFIRNKNFLLFFVLFLASLALTINSHSYHNTQYVSSANFLSGGLYSVKSSITDYFDLTSENQKLVQENERLLQQLQQLKENAFPSDSTINKAPFVFREAKVIHNSYSRTKNQLTINRGGNDSITVDMGVISPQGIVGIISHTSKNYASVQSVLNTNSQVVAKFKKSNHFGTLTWNGKEPNVVQLNEIPRLAPVTVGDTIVTDGKSTIFPEGIRIGTVKDFRQKEGADYFEIDVSLFTDMTSVKHVYVIQHKAAQEIKELENEANDVEE